MTDGTRPALGLSIGATNLAAVTADNAITRKPVLTLYRQRPPEVGVPAENPRLGEPGLVIGDFVDRVGDPAGIVAADGSVHRGEALIADALRALAYAATDGRALPDRVAVTYPAHWPSAAVDTLGESLGRVSEWSNLAQPLLVIPDAAAALFAARAHPGIPAAGTVAVCDFGGSGTNITLMEAAGDYRALAPTVRHRDFSGNLIDQALLTAVMANLPAGDPYDRPSTLARGSLGRLRADCRSAKEQLSVSAVASLAGELPSMHGDFRLTRSELDEVIRDSLDRFLTVLRETLDRNGIRDLSAVLAAGGIANIPAVVTTMSASLRVPVVTNPRPQLTPAIGAALRAARGPDAAATTMAGPAPARETGTATATAQTAAWPRRSVSRPAPADPETAIRAVPQAEPESVPEPEPPPEPGPNRTRWHRRLPATAAIGGLVVLLLAGVAVAVALTSGKPGTQATTTSPAAGPPAMTETPDPTVPPAVPQAHAPRPAAPLAPKAPAVPRIPELPPIPGVNEPIPGLDRLNQILQEFMGGAGLGGILRTGQ
ncbi:proline rich protein [Mycobacterium bohemicum DSM 44277]|uniref:Proline rich protein n=1 Tax=Mycobacterium bohemicum DSM 44277 TaxID=1236609 RepID=A0A0U0W2D1_MYCBE|nr:Hsp70 family protein [Mycobacterium bohemicum]CPR03052.1 proline rich protein [Mycobacterium bohemicum DSM 44277]